MPDMNGIEATRRIVAGHPDVAVILCSTHDPKDLPADTIRELWETRTSGHFVSR